MHKYNLILRSKLFSNKQTLSQTNISHVFNKYNFIINPLIYQKFLTASIKTSV